ncbi:KilA-N domain-containing protein [Brevinema andersonii]|uniref:KilA-N domain-containing protein n=1 Tax=Brevinema andersonii TaxID=34097 RepID=A0A1I1EMF3_BREAD|nr:KilA-N domain-containing protein [Brevinema andersonii]SFB88284.1 KilA-N domain-containing protein [Brevinema andersonii]
MKVIEQDTMCLIQREDGYINATALCQSAGKRWNHYISNDSTKEFLGELSGSMGIPITGTSIGNISISSVAGIPATGLIQVRQGGTPQEQGTYVHPKVAIHLAQWLSPKFAVFVTGIVLNWINGTEETTWEDEWSPYLGSYQNYRFFPRAWYQVMKRLYGQETTPTHINNGIYENALGAGASQEIRRRRRVYNKKAELYEFLTDEGTEKVQAYVKGLIEKAKTCVSFLEFEALLHAPLLETQREQ